MVSIHRKALRTPGVGGSKFGDHLYTRDLNEGNSTYVLEEENHFDLFNTPSGNFKEPLARYSVNTYSEKRDGANHQYFLFISSFEDNPEVKLEGNLGYFWRAKKTFDERPCTYIPFVGLSCPERPPAGSRIIYSVSRYNDIAPEPYNTEATDQLLTLSSSEASALINSEGNDYDRDYYSCSYSARREFTRYDDCRLGWVPNPSSSEVFAETELKQGILASELPSSEGIIVDYFEIGTPNGMTGVDFFARNGLAEENSNYAWLQRVEVLGSEEFPNRPFIDPLSDIYISDDDDYISDNLPYYDLGNNFYFEDSPRYFADSNNFEFTAKTLLVEKIDNNIMRFVDGIEWGYTINNGKTAKSSLVSVEESKELIAEFNNTLSLDFADFVLVDSNSSVPESIHEPSGIISLLLIVYVFWSRIIK